MFKAFVNQKIGIMGLDWLLYHFRFFLILFLVNYQINQNYRGLKENARLTRYSTQYSITCYCNLDNIVAQNFIKAALLKAHLSLHEMSIICLIPLFQLMIIICKCDTAVLEIYFLPIFYRYFFRQVLPMLNIYMNLRCSTYNKLEEVMETLTQPNLFIDDVQFDSLTSKLAQNIIQHNKIIEFYP